MSKIQLNLLLILSPLCLPFTSFLIPLYFTGGRAQALSFECKTDYADFTNRMSFLLSNFIQEIIPNPEALSANYLQPSISIE